MKTKKIIFWGTTGLFSLAMGFSSILYLTNNSQLQSGFQELGYPLYLIGFLGVAKLLGSIAILYRRFNLLTEWAYAGFTFNLLGAFYSHFQNGDQLQNTISPIIFLIILLISYNLKSVLYINETKENTSNKIEKVSLTI